jgi:hypothetical protein
VSEEDVPLNIHSSLLNALPLEDVELLTGSECTKTMDDLKKGPPDFRSIISSGEQYTDYDFNPADQGNVAYKRWTDTPET